MKADPKYLTGYEGIRDSKAKTQSKVWFESDNNDPWNNPTQV